MNQASEQSVLNAQMNAVMLAQRPSVLYRPTLRADGDMWCALYGEDLQTGICGFGKTAQEAMYQFDKAWECERTPQAHLGLHAAEKGEKS